ncbi:SDR family oxidoreductase [Sorangium sp. So ce1099]|uniref:SDR family oxidoreductase n=1 Tax=Sorangium sp. So ce1099 TaxID=3133331 RepID=UPI003F6389E6
MRDPGPRHHLKEARGRRDRLALHGQDLPALAPGEQGGSCTLFAARCTPQAALQGAASAGRRRAASSGAAECARYARRTPGERPPRPTAVASAGAAAFRPQPPGGAASSASSPPAPPRRPRADRPAHRSPASSSRAPGALCAGVTRTHAMQQAEALAPELVQALVAQHPMAHMATEDEIAGAALWLCSEAAGSVTGAPLQVDGGFLAA